MPVTSNYGFPTPSSGDDPDVPSDMLALAQDIDTKLFGTIATKAFNSGTLAGTYTGQQIKIWTKVGAFTTDSNGDTVVLASGEFSGGGVLAGAAVGQATFDVTCSLRFLTGNIVARVWGGGSLVVSSGAALSVILVGW